MYKTPIGKAHTQTPTLTRRERRGRMLIALVVIAVIVVWVVLTTAL